MNFLIQRRFVNQVPGLCFLLKPCKFPARRAPPARSPSHVSPTQPQELHFQFEMTIFDDCVFLMKNTRKVEMTQTAGCQQKRLQLHHYVHDVGTDPSRQVVPHHPGFPQQILYNFFYCRTPKQEYFFTIP